MKFKLERKNLPLLAGAILTAVSSFVDDTTIRATVVGLLSAVFAVLGFNDPTEGNV